MIANTLNTPGVSACFTAPATLEYLEENLDALRNPELPDDVRDVAVPVLAHRLVLDVDRVLRGEGAEGVVEEVLTAVPVPPVLA